MESKTPRTDAEFKLEAFFDGSGIVETVFVEFARELETELADKDRQLAEVLAEIENLKWHISNEKAKAKAALELNDRALEQLAEARAEIERLRSRNKMLDTAIAEMTEEQAALCAEEQSITELVATKDKLIEQMKDEIERLALEIENKQYTITCASEENQQLRESLAEARAEIEKQDTLLEKCLSLLKQQKEGGE